MENKVLFVISMVEEDFYNLRNIKADIKEEFPNYYSQIENLQIKERPVSLNSLTVSPMRFGNVSGMWLAENISTPSKVINQPISKELLIKELEADNYTHLCVSAFVDGYSALKECMEYVNKNYPDLECILGNVGAHYPQISSLFKKENIEFGDGVTYLRKKLNEDMDRAYRIPATVGYVEMSGNKSDRLPAAVLTTAVGCPHKCDFCSTASLFNGYYKDYNFSKEDIYDAIMRMEEKLGTNEFFIFLGEPNALINQKLWYDVFDYFRDKKGCYSLVAPVSLDILSGYDLEKLQNSAIKLEIANIGLESINTKDYKKLKGNDTKAQLKKFEKYGITIWGTFIIGFPDQTLEEIENEIKGFIDLNPTIPALLNLRPIRGTELFNELEREGKIKDDYLDVGYRFGFMAYEHKYIKKEFYDIPKMMLEYYDFIESELGHSYLRILEVKAKQKYLKYARDLTYIRYLYSKYSEIHEKWKAYFLHDKVEKINAIDEKFKFITTELKKYDII
ncbi:radical SAM protein [Anaerovorax odorimutans]|uniref:Radical SAM protein n=1 Tax=Anaerovorax odorimutans TaxID=109327 RepID=A0ABT1RTF4_9FIRM|nr:radical SAM protein [Anaerovorax odorimutans]MCQ4638488.1 radical SAM protein [Anaerovorax odorimutans]